MTIARCEAIGVVLNQRGVALVTGLALVTAVALLTAAAIREVTLETARTAHLAARVQARLAAQSAIDIAIADAALPENGATTLHYRFGADANYLAEVTIRYLGAINVVTDDTPEEVTAGIYEIVAEVRGPRGAHERRRRIWRVPIRTAA